MFCFLSQFSKSTSRYLTRLGNFQKILSLLIPKPNLTIMKFKYYFAAICILAITNLFAQHEGILTLKNGDIKEGLIENKGSKILFFEKEDAAPIKYTHEEIEHIKTGDIEYFRTSPKSKKLQEYQVLVNGDTKLVARHFKTNYGTVSRKYFSSNGVSPYYSPNSTPILVRGSRERGMIIKYYIIKPGSEELVQVYRLIVGDVDWLGYKKKVKKLLGDCNSLVNKINNGDFIDDEYGKEGELEAIVYHYNQKCNGTSATK